MKLRWTVYPTHEAASQAVADRLRAHVSRKPDTVLALPSGDTPKQIYALLAKDPRPFAHARVFALDEYWGLGAEDPRSFAAFFKAHVFGPLELKPERSHCLDGAAADAETEIARYEALLAAHGGPTLTLLGLGANGHIAFNEPAATLGARTHLVELAPPANAVAPRGVTMGVGTLLSAPTVLLIATGAKKAEAVKRMLSGTVDPRCPASLLWVHPGAEVFLDTAAAAGL